MRYINVTPEIPLPRVLAIVRSNNFGDQIVTFKTLVTKDSVTEYLESFEILNHEGNHLTDKEIKEYAKVK